MRLMASKPIVSVCGASGNLYCDGDRFSPTYFGYKQATSLAKQAMKENKRLRQLILEKNILSEDELDEILNLKKMTNPGFPGRRHEK